MSTTTNSPETRSYTGRTRRKKTRLSVWLGDLVARVLITVGGIGTIVAVCFVFVYLAYVVVPLFKSPSMTKADTRQAAWVAKRPTHVAIDEYQLLGWALYDDGELQVFRLETGETIDRRQLFSGVKLTAVSFTAGQDDAALGFEDGTIRLGRIGFEATFRDPEQIPNQLKDLAVGASAVLDKGVVQYTPQGQFRLQTVTAQLAEPVKVATGAVLALDHVAPKAEARMGAKEYTCSVYSADGKLQYCKLSEKRNPITRKTTVDNRAVAMPLDANAKPTHVLLTGLGDNVYVVGDNGFLTRYDTRNLQEIRVVEQVHLLPSSDAKLTICDFVLGRETIVCGDSSGTLRAWFKVRQDEPGEGDGFLLTRVHDLGGSGAAVTAFAASERSRMIAVGYADGRLRLYHVTTEQFMLEQDIGRGEPIQQVAMAPKDNGLFATTPSRLWRCELDPGHPEASLRSLFGPVWYEGYGEPLHIWQSSFAGVEPEMKLGLLPLVFGTLKATFYSMLFGAPLALLAAIYTSEFLTPGSRARIKPLIEMMASLPSVVLGFLAALVFAPLIEDFVPLALACFVTIPLAFLCGASLWQLLPHGLSLRMSRYRFWFMWPAIVGGFGLAWLAAPHVEQFFFAGDIKRWLDRQIGDGVGAWMFLMLPLSGFAVLMGVTLYVNTWLRGHAHRWSRSQFAWLNLGKLLASIVVVVGLAYGLSVGLNALGFDPRGTFVDTYEQRNALVVGFVMGFAIIPIIYTIADDALSTVPNHLRSGSLGCGATPWQTTWRIVIPTAMSGLFSALMIGLGRAVGETMIVLMAGGNTPITEWNVFNGFRTLAANIAVELPEAVRDSTHYRTLFLAALTLFILTFIINTAAEIVRLRFRKRAYQL